MDLVKYLNDQMKWSIDTFGPGMNTLGLLDHIRKELVEVEESPDDLEEWIDVIMLALDGAWRIGYSSEEISDMLVYKLNKNKMRKWPDWEKAEPNKAIEHISEDK